MWMSSVGWMGLLVTGCLVVPAEVPSDMGYHHFGPLIEGQFGAVSSRR